MPHLVRKAYLIDDCPFHPQIRRVLIDEGGGMVFIPTWGNTSDGFIKENYKLVLLPGGPYEMFEGYGKNSLWRYWYEKQAWMNETWAWCYMYNNKKFIAAYTNSEGCRFAV